MSRVVNVVQIFVASPSDLAAEREALETIISEWNTISSASFGIMFELIKWETHTRPAFGTDPQAVVNAQVGAFYDVFIGMLWSKFGTPTPRALSGTHEEFERAFQRLQTESSPPDIMIYFKDTPISPSKLNPEQLRRISDFRASLPALGGLYSTFEDMPSFQSSLRAHLASLAQQFSARLSHTNSAQKNLDETIAEGMSGEDDLGFLDYLEIFETRMESATNALNLIGEATNKVGKQIKQRTAALEKFGAAGADTATTRKIIKLVAGDLDAYAEVVKPQIPLLASSRDSAMHALASALSIRVEFNRSNDDLMTLRVELDQVATVAFQSKSSLVDFRSSVNNTPRMTGDLNRAKRGVIQQLDLLI